MQNVQNVITCSDIFMATVAHLLRQSCIYHWFKSVDSSNYTCLAVKYVNYHSIINVLTNVFSN